MSVLPVTVPCCAGYRARDAMGMIFEAHENSCPKYGISAPVNPPVSDPSETLALIAEHKPTLRWIEVAERWHAVAGYGSSQAEGFGSTIGDAVRACVARIKEAKRG